MVGGIGRSLKRDASFLQAIEAVTLCERAAHVLLHQHDRDTFESHPFQQAIDVLHRDRRESERDFVAEQVFRVGGKGSADRHELLLPAGQGRSGPRAKGFQRRQLLEQTLDGPGAAPAVASREKQVLVDRQTWE